MAEALTEAGAEVCRVHPFAKLKTHILRCRPDFIAESGVVWLGQVGRGQLLVEGVSTQRVPGHQVEMIGDQHQVAGHERPVHRTRRVADEQRADPEVRHRTNRQRCMMCRMTLVEVGPPAQGDAGHTIEQPRA